MLNNYNLFDEVIDILNKHNEFYYVGNGLSDCMKFALDLLQSENLFDRSKGIILCKSICGMNSECNRFCPEATGFISYFVYYELFDIVEFLIDKHIGLVNNIYFVSSMIKYSSYHSDQTHCKISLELPEDMNSESSNILCKMVIDSFIKHSDKYKYDPYMNEQGTIFDYIFNVYYMNCNLIKFMVQEYNYELNQDSIKYLVKNTIYLSIYSMMEICTFVRMYLKNSPVLNSIDALDLYKFIYPMCNDIGFNMSVFSEKFDVKNKFTTSSLKQILIAHGSLDGKFLSVIYKHGADFDLDELEYNI